MATEGCADNQYNATRDKGGELSEKKYNNYK